MSVTDQHRDPLKHGHCRLIRSAPLEANTNASAIVLDMHVSQQGTVSQASERSGAGAVMEETRVPR